MSTSLVFDIVARDRASDKFDRVGNSASRSSGKLKDFAKMGALAVAGGAVVAGKALIDMTKGAIEDERAQKTLAVALKNSTGATRGQVKATEDWISRQGKALGVADDELRPALGKLARATGDVGKAQELTSLAMDISAGSGKSLSSVTEALMKAQNGSLGGLSRLGVATKDAAGEEKSLKQITKELADLHGGQAAAAASTTEGKMKRLKIMYDETKESIGAKLIPVADKLATLFMNKVMPAAGQVGDWIKQKLIPPIRDFAESAAPKAKSIMNALKDAFKDSKPFLDLVGKVITNVVVPGLKKLLDVAGPALVGAIRGLGKGLRFVGEAGTWMWNNALQPAFKFMVKGVGWVLDGWSKMLEALAKVPGFGWAKKASEDMAKAADKAYAMAEGIKKIPTKKTVTVTTIYMTRNKGKEGRIAETTGDPTLGRMNTQKSIGQRFMELLAEGMEKGGKKVDKVLAASRDRIKSALSTVRSDMKSLSQSIASALNPDAFSFSDIMQEVDAATGAITTAAQSALQQSMAQLTGTNSALTSLMSVFGTLKGGASKGFLSSLMQSGNVGLMQQYAADPAALAEASRLFDANAAMAKGLGDQGAEAVLGDRIDEIYKRETDRLLKKEDDLPKAIRKELRDLFRDGVELRISGGKDAGQKAHLRGAWT